MVTPPAVGDTDSMVKITCSNCGKVAYFNENARCLLCIEIEGTGSRKHCLGDLINASALGRVGILVARSEKMLKAFLRQREYLRFLGSVGKNTLKTDNTLILSTEQFDKCLAVVCG